MIEVELKFEILTNADNTNNSSRLLQEKLQSMPFVHYLEQVVNDDVYYDTANFDCLQQAVFVRIRNHTHLEVKYHEHDDPAHMHSTERVFPLEPETLLVKEMNSLLGRFIPHWQEAETIAQAIDINNLTNFAHIQNRRVLYRCEDLTLCIDQVEGLGYFFEVETYCEKETEVEQSLAKLRDFVTTLSFPTLQIVEIGYVELWLRLHLPKVYRLGKYQMSH
jgi:adenylate cyclase, class 2